MLFPIIVVALCEFAFMVVLRTSWLMRCPAYVVQGHRYNILQELGCFPALYNTLLTYFLVNWWPLVLGFIASVYCGMSALFFARLVVSDLANPL